jgi:tetratricopeptide (TPR) repeat protein
MLIHDVNLKLKFSLWLLLGSLVISSIAECGSLTSKTESPVKPMPLFDDLGAHHYPVSISVPDAQRYFDQGLILAFSFNHSEAARSFQEAYRLDPNCALCYWGEALVLGPNINAPMDPSVVPQAYKSVQQSQVLANNATEKEQALISALAKRYSKTAPTNRRPLDEAYAAAMGGVASRFPGDAVIAALFAESLMDLHPWNFWTKQGEAQPWTAEIVATLERALEIDANNPLANHLYIHVMEASPYAAKAIPSAQRLPSLVPGSGHLVHMPAHIYIRVGRYRDAILANQRAVKIDQGYLSHAHAESIYTIAYVPHNYHFLWAAAIKTGQKQLATKAADDAAAQVKPELMREPGFSGTLQHFYTLPLYTKALFGDWDAILMESAPSADLLYPTGVWHYVRGLALLRKGKPDESARELEKLEKITKDPAIAKLTIFDLNPVTQILQIAQEMLRGELAAQNKDYDKAVIHLQRAVELEDGLNYTEPKDWYLPPRQVLGAILLDGGQAGKAEQAYRQDLVYHPQNGWSLFGLALSLREQGKNQQADSVNLQFKEVWADADITLTGSRF